MAILDIKRFNHPGRVVRTPVNPNPGSEVARGINFSCINMFFNDNILCSLGLFELKTEGQNNTNRQPYCKIKKKEIKSPANPYRGFEQLGHEAEETTTFN